MPEPENRETPLGEVQTWVTPNRLFFVRNHFDRPEIDLAGWRLSIGGLVDRPTELDWDEVQSLPQRSIFVTLECAGNGRSFLKEPVTGVQWGAGAVGHAEWTGVPLRDLLIQVGLSDDAVEVVFTGADTGTEKDHPEPMHFARGLPREKALDPDTLLATRMNGEPLEPSHGFPLRLIVPGWYGVASVKWLTNIEAVATPFDGFYQTSRYIGRRMTGRGLETDIIGPMPVKSEIISPRAGDVLGVGANRVFGFAWAGEDTIEAVEVSVDGGRTWGRAELIHQRARYSWVLWEYPWTVATGGEYQIAARAISEGGQVQPAAHDNLRGGYLINFSRMIPVYVDPSKRSVGFLSDTKTLLSEVAAAAEERARMRLDVDIELELTDGAGI